MEKPKCIASVCACNIDWFLFLQIVSLCRYFIIFSRRNSRNWNRSRCGWFIHCQHQTIFHMPWFYSARGHRSVYIFISLPGKLIDDIWQAQGPLHCAWSDHIFWDIYLFLVYQSRMYLFAPSLKGSPNYCYYLCLLNLNRRVQTTTLWAHYWKYRKKNWFNQLFIDSNCTINLILRNEILNDWCLIRDNSEWIGAVDKQANRRRLV